MRPLIAGITALAATLLVAALAPGLAHGAKAPVRTAKAPSGAAVFKSAGCGGCHTLKAAKSSGAVGPNLDRLKPTAATVVRQVTNGGGGMPSFKGRLSKAQITAVASYVATSSRKK